MTPIGVIHSPYAARTDAPRQGAGRPEIASIDVYPAFAPALEGLARSPHVLVFYWADRAEREALHSRRHARRGETRGVFASRSPARPNPICLCVCALLGIEGRTLRVRGLDALDGSPLLDLKPFVAELDAWPAGDFLQAV